MGMRKLVYVWEIDEYFDFICSYVYIVMINEILIEEYYILIIGIEKKVFWKCS